MSGTGVPPVMHSGEAVVSQVINNKGRHIAGPCHLLIDSQTYELLFLLGDFLHGLLGLLDDFLCHLHLLRARRCDFAGIYRSRRLSRLHWRAARKYGHARKKRTAVPTNVIEQVAALTST